MKDSLLVHVHIPRTAGTSIARWLLAAAQQGLTTGHARIYTSTTFYSDDHPAVHAGDRRLATMSSHNVRTYPARWSGRPTFYFTIVREPVSHFGSVVRYMLENRVAFGVPDDVITPRDAAGWLLDPPDGGLGWENSQTNHLALDVWCESSRRLAGKAFAQWSAADRAAYRRDRLAVAEDALRGFLMVGSFERLFESLFILRQRAQRIGIRLTPARAVPFVNATEREADDLAWLAPGDPFGERVRASLAQDFTLHAFACRLFDRQLADAMASPLSPAAAEA